MARGNWRKRVRAAVLALVMGLACPLGVAQQAPPQPAVEEDLNPDPNLPRDEQLRRHKLRLEKIFAEHRAQQAELLKNREVDRQQLIEQQRQTMQAKPAETAPPAPAPMQPMQVTPPPMGNFPPPMPSAMAGRPPMPGSPAMQPSGPSAVPFRISRAIVLLRPFRVLTQAGQDFDTEVRLHNVAGRPFDEIVLELQYDPLVAAPLEVNDAAVYESLEEQPRLEINHSTGRLRYAARLKEAISPTTTTLLSIRWRALNPIQYSEIGFVTDDEATRIGKDGGNLLGYVAGGRRSGGTLPASLRIAPDNDSPRTLMPPFDEVAIAGIDEQVHLRLQAERESVEAGHEWVVSLVIRNDACLPFSSLSVRILFDPAKLEVIDWHAGNWIRKGINIYDGFAHKAYPFEVHRANQADNERGEIVYHVGTRKAGYFPSGELARIKFQALTGASLSDVRFDFELPDQVDQVITDVKFIGSSVLFPWQRSKSRTAGRPAPEPLRTPGT